MGLEKIRETTNQLSLASGNVHVFETDTQIIAAHLAVKFRQHPTFSTIYTFRIFPNVPPSTRLELIRNHSLSEVEDLGKSRVNKLMSFPV